VFDLLLRHQRSEKSAAPFHFIILGVLRQKETLFNYLHKKPELYLGGLLGFGFAATIPGAAPTSLSRRNGTSKM